MNEVPKLRPPHHSGRRVLGAMLFLSLAVASLATAADGDVVTLKSHGHKSGVKYIAIARDGSRLLSAGSITFQQGEAQSMKQDVGINVWDVAAGKKLRTIATPEFVAGVFISPDGKTGGWVDTINKSLAVINLDTGEQLRSIDLPFRKLRLAEELAMSGDGSVLAIGTRSIDPNSKDKQDRVGTIHVYETTNWKCIHTLSVEESDVARVLLSSDGKTLIGIGGGVRMWTLPDGKQASMPWAQDPASPIRWMTSACLSADGSLLAAVTLKEYVIVDVKTGVVKQRIAQPKGLTALDTAFSGDGKFILVATKPGAIWIYSVDTGKNVRRVTGVDATGVVDMSLSADGSCLATGGASLKVFKTEPLLK